MIFEIAIAVRSAKTHEAQERRNRQKLVDLSNMIREIGTNFSRSRCVWAGGTAALLNRIAIFSNRASTNLQVLIAETKNVTRRRRLF